jgi:histidine triad (HIT) family protein
MGSIFSKIVSGEIPAFKVAEDDHHLAFLDINPVAMGHVLVVPKKETDYIFDLETIDYQSLWKFAAQVAKGLKRAVPCIKVGVSVIGLEVPHAHIHLVPLNSMGDINFSKTKLNPGKEELESLCEKIKRAISLS